MRRVSNTFDAADTYEMGYGGNRQGISTQRVSVIDKWIRHRNHGNVGVRGAIPAIFSGSAALPHSNCGLR